MSGSGINRRDLLALAGAGAVGASLPQISTAGMAVHAGSGGDRPNIILYVPDEMRADALSCYGNPVTRTPNFDRLAAQGMRFENCHIQFPVCGASRCSFLTGWPTSVRGHRSLYYFLRPDEPESLAALQTRLLNWYVNTSGIAPMDKDGRDPPPFYPTPSFAVDERSLLDH